MRTAYVATCHVAGMQGFLVDVAEAQVLPQPGDASHEWFFIFDKVVPVLTPQGHARPFLLSGLMERRGQARRS